MERGVRFERLTISAGDGEILGALGERVRGWWVGKFGKRLSGAQRLAVRAIGRGENVLVCAPTGTGKTLCAFASILGDWIGGGERGGLQDCVDTVYVGRLKGRSRDSTGNLVGPMGEMGWGGNDECRMTNDESNSKSEIQM